jgi:hypothetical protein
LKGIKNRIDLSRYSIYQISHYDPQLIGKRKRRIVMFYGFLSPLFIFFFMMLENLNIDYLLIAGILFPLYLCIYFYLYYKLKAYNKNLKIIGYVEFTRSCLVKHLGDSVSGFDYNMIKSIELNKHIPAVTMLESKSGFFTYTLSIEFTDLHKETLIISDLPEEKNNDLNITETLRALKHLTPSLIMIN